MDFHWVERHWLSRSSVMCGSKLGGIHLPPSVGAVWGLPWGKCNLGALKSAFKF